MTDAKTLTAQLGGKWHRRYGVAPCPCCQPERRRDQDALTLHDGLKGLLAHCKKLGCAFRDIMAAAGIAPGTGTGNAADPFAVARNRAEEQAESMKRAAQAHRVWREALPIAGTVASATGSRRKPRDRSICPLKARPA